jgi:PTH1 family peptidyl-tRNA hydrolase
VEPVLAAGLGNPGEAYRVTRHNAGFSVLDELCRRYSCRMGPGRGEYLAGQIFLQDISLVLLKPMTYMNGSGRAVAEAMEQFAVAPDRILVIVDDIMLPLGRLRMRPKGSDGGHNGLGSVIEELHTEEFARLRLGIQSAEPPAADRLASYVLSPFLREETPLVSAMTARAADMVIEFVVAGVDAAMTKCNST